MNAPELDWQTLWALGPSLSAAQLAELEARLESDTHDREARFLLLAHSYSLSRESETHLDIFRRHSLWFIKHHPRSIVHNWCGFDETSDPVGYPRARTRWLAALDPSPDDLRLLKNAATFASLGDHELACSLFARLEMLEPTNSLWPQFRGHSLRELAQDARQKRNARMAFERAFTLAPNSRSAASSIAPCAELSLELGELEQARGYANKLLELARADPDDAPNGEALYTGHSVLGQVALAEDNLEAAQRALLEAGRTPGGPGLGSFGPDFTLANLLIQRECIATVIQFLELCTHFWRPFPLRRWIERLRAGERFELNRFVGAYEDFIAREKRSDIVDDAPNAAR